MDAREDLGKSLYRVECGVDGREKLFAEAITLRAVPPVTTGQVPSDLAAVDNR